MWSNPLKCDDTKYCRGHRLETGELGLSLRPAGMDSGLAIVQYITI